MPVVLQNHCWWFWSISAGGAGFGASLLVVIEDRCFWFSGIGAGGVGFGALLFVALVLEHRCW